MELGKPSSGYAPFRSCEPAQVRASATEIEEAAPERVRKESELTG